MIEGKVAEVEAAMGICIRTLDGSAVYALWRLLWH